MQIASDCTSGNCAECMEFCDLIDSGGSQVEKSQFAVLMFRI